MKHIYLDNNATTPVDERVLDAMLPYLKGMYGNPSSVHFTGREAKAAMENGREQVAKFMNADPSEIYFTSGGTESDNIALKGAAYLKRDKKNHIIVSSIEHHAILESAHYLEKEGFAVDYLGVDKDGFISPDELKEKITDKTSIVSVMQANNEVGSIQDIATLAAITKEAGAVFHTDSVQAAGKIKIDVEELGCDMLSISGHKVYGPKGIGVIYIKKGKRITPLFHGGHHEKKRRAGTENIPGIVAIGAAVELAESIRESEHHRLHELSEFFIDGVMNAIPNVYMNGPRNDRRVSSTVNLSFEYIEGESIILSLDMKGIGVASGSACTSGSLSASHVLTAMSVPIELAQGSIRFSMGRFTTKEDLEYTISVLPEIIEKLRSMSPLYSKK